MEKIIIYLVVQPLWNRN